MNRICIFAGASNGARPAYGDAARKCGEELGRRGFGMVYGGASRGLMGACADAALLAGAEVIGVLPRALNDSEIAHHGLTELRIVETLHERKAVMHALSDAFIALPGGCGTMDELFEAITWFQLGLHDKPVALLDTDGYYAPLVAFLEHMHAEGFTRVRPKITLAATPGALIDALFPAPQV